MYRKSFDFISHSYKNSSGVFWHDFCNFKLTLNDKLQINEAFADLKKATVKGEAANKKDK